MLFFGLKNVVCTQMLFKMNEKNDLKFHSDKFFVLIKFQFR